MRKTFLLIFILFSTTAFAQVDAVIDGKISDAIKAAQPFTYIEDGLLRIEVTKGSFNIDTLKITEGTVKKFVIQLYAEDTILSSSAKKEVEVTKIKNSYKMRQANIGPLLTVPGILWDVKIVNNNVIVIITSTRTSAITYTYLKQ